MKKQKAKLVFEKQSITELTDSQIIKVKGGCQWGDSSGTAFSINISVNVPTKTVDTSINTLPDDIIIN